jgi:hypothetical protein
VRFGADVVEVPRQLARKGSRRTARTRDLEPYRFGSWGETRSRRRVQLPASQYRDATPQPRLPIGWSIGWSIDRCNEFKGREHGITTELATPRLRGAKNAACCPPREQPEGSSPAAEERGSVGLPVFKNVACRPELYAARVIPWIVIALVAVPLVVVGFVAMRRRTTAGEHPASEDARARARTEQEFAEAEAYEAKWREEDLERFHQERLP